MNYNPYDPNQGYAPQQPAQPQAQPAEQPQAAQPAQPQYQQYQQYPQQPQYQQQYPQYQQAPQYQQPRPYAPRPQQVARPSGGSDGALLTFVLIYFFTNLTAIIMQETCRFNSTTRIIYGIIYQIMTFSFILVPLGLKGTGKRVFAFILFGMMVMYMFLVNLRSFGVDIF